MSVAYAKPLPISRSSRVAVAALILLVALLAFPAVASAATRHVAVGGSNAANDCLAAQSPCLTVQHAIGVAADGDVVAIGAGLYTENVVVEKSLTLRGVAPVVADPELLLDAGVLTTELRGSGGAPALTLKSPVDTLPAPEIAVEDLRIDGNANFGAVQVESNGPQFNRKQIRSLALDGVAIVGSPSAINTTGFKPVHGFVLEHSAIRCTGAVNPTGGVLLGVADGGEDLPVAVTGNYMTECGAAINAGDHTGFAGATGAVAGEATISGNTIEGNRWGCIQIALAYEDLRIEDNTLSECNLDPGGSGVDLQTTPGPTHVTVTGNLIEDGNVGVIVQNITSSDAAAGADAHFEVRGNTIAGMDENSMSVGVRLGANEVFTPVRAPEDMAIEIAGNTIVDNSRGFDWQTAAGDEVGENLVLRGNRFANDERGVSLFGADRTLDAEGNWWGCNEGAQAQAAGKTPAGCDSIGIGTPASSSVDIDPWLVLTLAADPAQIGVGGQAATLRAAVESDSAGEQAVPPLPDGTPIGFATNLGLLSDTSAPLLAGATTATLTSGDAAGTATVTASLDGEEATAAVEIVAPPVPVDDPEPPSVPQPTTTNAPAGVQVASHRQPQVGTLSCLKGCQVAARYGTARVGAKKFNVKVRVRSTIEPGGSAKIRVVLPRWVRRELAEAGIASITLRLRVVDPEGGVTVHKVKVKISPPRAA